MATFKIGQNVQISIPGLLPFEGKIICHHRNTIGGEYGIECKITRELFYSAFIKGSEDLGIYTRNSIEELIPTLYLPLKQDYYLFVDGNYLDKLELSDLAITLRRIKKEIELTSISS